MNAHFPIMPYPSYGYLSNNRITNHILTFDIDQALACSLSLSLPFSLSWTASSAAHRKWTQNWAAALYKSDVEQEKKNHTHTNNVKLPLSRLSSQILLFYLIITFLFISAHFDHSKLAIIYWCLFGVNTICQFRLLYTLYWILNRTQK